MSGKRWLRVGILLFGLARIGAAEELEISGFTDILYQDRQGENSSFAAGAFEIDFASEFSDKISFEGAIVVEGDEVGLGQTLADFELLDEKLGVQAGLLDMPFGIDYQVFAAPDRKLISPPLVTELMMDGGWSDTGINLYGSLAFLNCNLYIVNGMGSKYEIEDDTTSALAPANQIGENNSAKTAGGRLGFSPAKDFEIGFSYARGPYLDNNTEEFFSRAGGDIQFAYKFFQIKGEFVKGKEEIPASVANEHDCYYIQLLGKASEKVYGAVRYGCWKPKGGDEVTSFTAGLGYDITENVSLRSEYRINDETPNVDNDLFSAQAVVNF